MGGSSSKQNYTLRYAPYIETQHAQFLSITEGYRSICYDSPYEGYTEQDVNAGYFGVGYLLSSFPSLYDMFGVFMAGFNIESIWPNFFKDVVSADEITDYKAADTALVDDLLQEKNLPSYMLAARELNIVGSSSFIIGKANIESARIKNIVNRDMEYHAALFAVWDERFTKYLDWQRKVITTYAIAMKGYYESKVQGDNANYNIAAKDSLWAFTVLDFERVFLRALQGTFMSHNAMRKRSTVSGVLLVASDTVTGAYIGASVGGYIGAIVGGVIGFVVGIAQWLLE